MFYVYLICFRLLICFINFNFVKYRFIKIFILVQKKIDTCYMNSLIQALYFSGPFARLICSTENTGPLVVGLQETFAFLTMSNRKQFSPRCLLSCLPSYFVPGVQQDSSEYSKFLFDELGLFGCFLFCLKNNTFKLFQICY
jgi:hypothetical protein